MARNWRRPLPGQFGTTVNTETAVYPTIPNNSNISVNLGLSPRRQYFVQAWVCAFTVGTYVGTATVTIQKISGGVTTPLTAATDLTNATQANNVTFQIKALGTLADAQRLLLPGDLLEATFITNNTVSAQPTGGVVGAEVDITV